MPGTSRSAARDFADELESNDYLPILQLVFVVEIPNPEVVPPGALLLSVEVSGEMGKEPSGLVFTSPGLPMLRKRFDQSSPYVLDP
ncbi:MAG: hypothetical protein KDA27_25965, partial [Candidatus Eisenbacteria bacterium]|nr:hypothetical protein [Candidatus Eisenbacteria bacterium]